MAVYLWTLDVAVAVVITGVMGVTALFYGATAVLGAMYEFCPYVTQISSYIKAVRDTYRGTDDIKKNTSSAYTSSNDLKALMWLANNARDPAVVDCSYQALSGLRLPVGSSQSTLTDASEDQKKSLISGIEDMLSRSDGGLTLSKLFIIVCEQFARLARNREELSASSWANAARYTKALIGLGSYIQRQGMAVPSSTKKSDGYESGSTDLQIISPVLEVLAISDNLWTENAPPLHADAYSSFVTNELFLLSLAEPNTHRMIPSSQHDPMDLGLNTGRSARQDIHIVDITPGKSAPSHGPHLSTLRSQYSRSLARASTLIWLHSLDRFVIGHIPLRKLLDALHAASLCDSLNPSSGYSTHHPQSVVGDFKLIVPYGPTAEFDFEAQDLSNGVLGSLIRLIQMPPKVQDDPESGTYVRFATVQAFASLAPVLLQQVCGLDKKEMLRDLDYTTWLEGAPLDMDKVRYFATRQALFVLRILGTRLGSHVRLCGNALALIRSLLRENNIWTEASGLAVVHRGIDIIPLLECVAADDSAFSLLSSAESFNIINMVQYDFLPEDSIKWNLCDTLLPPNCLPPLIRMLKIAGMDKRGTERLLESVVQSMRNRENGPTTINSATRVDIPRIEYLSRFTHVADGFFALGQAAFDQVHAEAVTRAIAQITHLAAGKDSGLVVDPIELQTPAVPGFLDAVVLVAKYCVGKSDSQKVLLDFSADALDLLDMALKDTEARRRLQGHEAYSQLAISLVTIGDDDIARGLLERVNRAMEELGITVPKPELGNELMQAEGPVNSTSNTQPHDSEGHLTIHMATSKTTTSDTEPTDGNHKSDDEPKE